MCFLRRSSNLLLIITLLLAIPAANADWWDNFVNGAHEKIVQTADWVRDKAGPTVREKFDSAKQTLQDPETHEKVQEWVEEEAVPKIKEKFEQFKSFVNEDVMPEVQKMVEAGVEASKRRSDDGGKDDEKVRREND